MNSIDIETEVYEIEKKILDLHKRLKKQKTSAWLFIRGCRVDLEPNNKELNVSVRIGSFLRS